MRQTILLSLLCSLLSCSLTFDRCLSANRGNVLQQPYQLEVNSGESAVMKCTIKEYRTKGANMRKRFEKILFIGPSGSTIATNYEDRLSWSGDMTDFILTLNNLTVNDSDIYLCDTITLDTTEICSFGTLLIVRPQVEKAVYQDKDAANEEQICGKTSFSLISYIIIPALFVLCVVIFMYMKRKRTKEKQSFNQNTYVDMTQTLRRNTMGNSFIYNQTQNGSVPT
ncbi:uncharacterized protein LOC130297544 [Hyla sarda]|uniref:uncharacterized protein LOC130297544 n=1 Tax=Hyla sarda TaxID=327740 RepID=UPI0024C35663|nr:uncharacterized protein LOC130297544 [Hyla sarda]